VLEQAAASRKFIAEWRSKVSGVRSTVHPSLLRCIHSRHSMRFL
jgi:hypothetical protein